MIYTLQNLSVLGLCLRIHDSGLFAWISQTALSRTYFIIAAIQYGPSLHIEEPSQPIPKGTLLFFVVHISHYDEICISQYIGTPVTDVITSSHLDKNVCFFWLFEGPWGPSMIKLGLSCFLAILPPISMYM